jgi:FkbM family methyltransferase
LEQSAFRDGERAFHLHNDPQMKSPAHDVTVAPASGVAAEDRRPDADDLKHALSLVRDISASVDAGRTWAAIRAAVERPPIPPALEARLQTIEVDVQRVLSVVCTPGSTPTYLGGGLVYLPTLLGFPLIGFGDDLQITASLLLNRRWDVPTTQLFERVLRPGDTFLDVGANIGYFTIYGAALVGFKGRVHAFEPNPRTFDLLARNVRLNNVGHVCTLQQAAVGADCGERALNTFRRNQASSTFATLPDRLLGEWHERPQTQTVTTTTLDAAFAGNDTIFSCIKIDVEGSDALLWAGGERFFRDHVDARTLILTEWNPPALRGMGADPRDLLAAFARHGFSVWRRDDTLAATPVSGAADLDDWCISELILARDPSRVSAVCQ